VLLRVTNKHAGRRRRYAQATTRSKTTQHSIHDILELDYYWKNGSASHTDQNELN